MFINNMFKMSYDDLEELTVAVKHLKTKEINPILLNPDRIDYLCRKLMLYVRSEHESV